MKIREAKKLADFLKGKKTSKEKVVNSVSALLALKLLEKQQIIPKDGIDGKNGVDGINGKDGLNAHTPVKGVDYNDGKDGSPDTPEQIADKLNTLEDILDTRVIKDFGLIIGNIDKKISTFSNAPTSKGPIDQRWHGGGLSSVSHDTTLIGTGAPDNPLSVVIVTTDEKVKYDAADPTAGYLADKVIAGTGILVAEGTGADENKLQIINSSPDQTVSITGTGVAVVTGTYPVFNIDVPVPDLSAYVPYVGATANVDLGARILKSNIIDASGVNYPYRVTFTQGSGNSQQSYSASNFTFRPSTGRLSVSYIESLFQIVENSATNQYFPVLFGNGVSDWSYLYGTPVMRYNPSLGELSAPFFVGDGSLLTNLPSSGGGDSHVICKGYEWRKDTAYPPTWYDTGFAGLNIGYEEFWGRNTNSQNQYVHFVLEVPDNVPTDYVAHFYVNFATADAYNNRDRFSWLIDWTYADPGNSGSTFRMQYGTNSCEVTTNSGGDAWNDFLTDDTNLIATPIPVAGGKYVCRMTRDINDRDTAADTDLALLVIGIRWVPGK